MPLISNIAGQTHERPGSSGSTHDQGRRQRIVSPLVESICSEDLSWPCRTRMLLVASSWCAAPRYVPVGGTFIQSHEQRDLVGHLAASSD
jgi:hypothetical protein